MKRFTKTLGELGLTVSTGKVVDFRAREFLHARPGIQTVPLIYPCHFGDGFVEWPKDATNKPNAISDEPASLSLLIPSDHYVLVKRFSSKEERRRIVAAIWDPDRYPVERVGFENHVNYFHLAGKGLQPWLAKGLAVYLNSTLVDDYFRQFNGHTQVNATDLRNLYYPDLVELEQLGSAIGTHLPDQTYIDELIDRLLAAKVNLEEIAGCE